MNKWCGKIGFVADHVETSPGVWEEGMIERSYYGDIVRNSRSLQTTNEINDNVTISVTISIVADPYANQHIYDMRYIEFQGVKCKVNNVEVEYPRLKLSLGGKWNGN